MSAASGRLARLLVLLLAAGCASVGGTYPPDAPVRAAADTPERFLVGSTAPDAPLTEPQATGACRNPMVDPRDGTRVTLVQSQRGATGQIGDYQVPDGRYGVAPGELLRMDCGTGRPLGVVPRRG